MADPKKPDFEAEEPPLVTPEASLAADDPTAVWDAESLREAGLEVDVEVSEPPSAPATQGSGSGLPSIVAEDAAPAEPCPPQAAPLPQAAARAAPGPRKEMGWGATLALAVSLGAAVYLVVRYLR